MSSALRRYDVNVGAHRTSMLLSDEDAAAMGEDATLAATTTPLPDSLPAEGKARTAVHNKQRTTEGAK